MDDSILATIRKMLVGMVSDDTGFDGELLLHINTAIMTLRQAGVGPQNGFLVESAADTWDDYLGDDIGMLQMVKDYIFLSVKIVFDPPTNSSVLQTYKDLMQEYIWRLREQTDSSDIFEVAS